MLEIQQKEKTMREYLDILEKTALFDGIDREDISGLLVCLGATVREVKKNGQILSEGDPAKYVAILLSGSASITNVDIYGNRSILSKIYVGDLFGESFACADAVVLPVSVVAEEDSRVMLIDCKRVITSCRNACGFHNQMIYNLLRAVAGRNLEFYKKLQITARRTTREKLMAFLLTEAKRAGSRHFFIDYDRQALADYLGVERSAMSAELGKLQKDGILQTNRKEFILL